MNIFKFTRLRLRFTLLVTAAELTHLLWEHFNGGVVSHHLLNRSDLPAISNWLGLFALPLLTWITLYFLELRSSKYSKNAEIISSVSKNAIFGCSAAFLYGACLAFCFANGNETAMSYLFPGMFLLALFLPVYRAECLLGFVLGMTLIFGAILPMIIGGVVVLLSSFCHFVLWPFSVRFWRFIRRSQSEPL
jgi:hypothetical protein